VPTSNLRTSTRHDCELAVEVTSHGERHELTTRNLSLGGTFVVSPAWRPAFNARVQLRLTVPTQKDPIEIGGTVRWVNDEGFAVQFDGLRAKDVWTLGKFFER
jgi:hypothetical protein